MRSIAFALCFALATQVRGDDLDDLRASYLEKLQVINDNTLLTISAAEHTLDETDEYIRHAADVFDTDGNNRINIQISALNATAEELTLNAVLGNKPASVLTCISNARGNGETALNQLRAPYEANLDKLVADSTKNFGQQRDTVGIIKSQLQGLFNTNSDKLNTCVVEACFDTNLQAADKQYATLSSNVQSITADVKTARANFNSAAIGQVDDLRDAAQSANDDATKKMGKC